MINSPIFYANDLRAVEREHYCTIRARKVSFADDESPQMAEEDDNSAATQVIESAKRDFEGHVEAVKT
jgi:hypothetical protein